MTSLTLVAPPLDGPPSGGNVYNRALLRALERLGHPARHLTLEDVLAEEAADGGAVTLCDSLYLEAFPLLARRFTKCWLLLHYLPSTVRFGRAPDFGELDETERRALLGASGIVTTGRFLQELVLSYSLPQAPRIACVRPGTSTGLGSRSEAPNHETGQPLRAVIVGPLTEGKGLLPFLDALAVTLGRRGMTLSPLSLSLVGSPTVDAEYAAACRARVDSDARLSEVVRFVGSLPHDETLGVIEAAHVFVSTSRMESFGMALFEARARGIPVLCLDAGNTREHVDPRAGGELAEGPRALAEAFVDLVNNPTDLEKRRSLASAHRTGRDWALVAHELLLATGLQPIERA